MRNRTGGSVNTLSLSDGSDLAVTKQSQSATTDYSSNSDDAASDTSSVVAAEASADDSPLLAMGKDYSVEGIDFTWMDNEEPHRRRRAEILAKYPEIKQLYGPEWRTKYMVGATVALQTFLAIALRESSWPVFLTVIYLVGATANHSLFLAIHEWSHNLGFKHPRSNQLGSILANLPIGIPYAATFKPYHMDHHRNQGVHGVDTDIAHPVEASIIQNRTPLKALYFFFQLAFYALRPTFIKPPPVTQMVVLNFVVQVAYDAALLYCFGWNALLYLLLSTFICGSFHPTAGHFLSEHLEVVEGVETYSYYGPLNYVTYNVGYHNEHHDFPYVPWSRLPEVRRIASEYYDTIPQCDSWCGIIWNYVTSPNLGAYSRVKRTRRIAATERINPNDNVRDGTIDRSTVSQGKKDM